MGTPNTSFCQRTRNSHNSISLLPTSPGGPNPMIFPILLPLLAILPASQAVCELKEDAKDLIDVNYFGFSDEQSDDADTAYVDEVLIKMKGGGAWSGLLKSIERGICSARRLKVHAYYKKKTDENWESLRNKRIQSRDDFEARNLNPCEQYEVKVTALSPEVTVGIFDVGPYYRQNFKQEYLIDGDNRHYQMYADSASNHINVTGFERSATINVAKMCAKTVAVHVYNNNEKNGDENDEEVIIAVNPESNAQQSAKIEGLEPCTEYHVDLRLFLKDNLTANMEEQEDFFLEDIVSFYTMPDSEHLKDSANVNVVDNVLTWNFVEFFQQTCADDDNFHQVSTDFTLSIRGDNKSVSDEGREDLPKHECDFTVLLAVHYTKAGIDKEVIAFNKTITGTNDAEDSLKLEAGNIVKTLNPCEEGQLEITAESINLTGNLRSRNLPTSINFPGDVATPQPISGVEWEGCSDQNITMRREGRVVANLVIPHPGRNKVFTLLEKDTTTNTTVVFKQPDNNCEVGKFMIEIECKDTQSGEEDSRKFQLEELLQFTNMTPETKYECKGRLVKTEDEEVSAWTESVVVTTHKEVKNVIEETTLVSTLVDVQPTEESSGLPPEKDPEVEIELEVELQTTTETKSDKGEIEPSKGGSTKVWGSLLLVPFVLRIM